MAQFDVHKNIGKQRDAIPFVVVVQSSLYDSYRRRVVVPLVRRSTLDRTSAFLDTPLNPVFTVKGIKVVLHPLEMVSVDTARVGWVKRSDTHRSLYAIVGYRYAPPNLQKSPK
jgi:toxin CcdB